MMKGSIIKSWNRTPIIVLTMAVIFVSVISARTGMAADNNQVQRRINVPYLGTSQAEVELFEPAILWFGQVTPTNNYADVRVWYYDDYIKFMVNIMDRRKWYDTNPTSSTLEEWDAVTLFLNLDGNTGNAPSSNSYRFVSQLNRYEADENYQTVYKGNGTKWLNSAIPFTASAVNRGTANVDENSKGWQTTVVIPFSSLGLAGRPADGEKWGFAVHVHDRDEADGNPMIANQVWPEAADADVPATWGEMNFGVPVYITPAIDPQGSVTIRQDLDGGVVMDGHVGGHGNCGGEMDPWTEWGEAVYLGWNSINIQNQWDISDWPCFSKYYVTIPLDKVPPGKTIIDATFSMHRFGNAGGAAGIPYDSFIETFTIAEDWDEATLNWNNAPLAVENIGGTWVEPIQDNPQQFRYYWNVSRAVAAAYEAGEPLRLAMYSIDGEQHSGKYFYSSDGRDFDPTQRPELQVVWGDVCDTCPTNTPVPPTSTSAASEYQQQDISLDAGWNMISSYVQPENSALSAVFADIVDDLVIVKNGAGDVYWPAQSVNTIVNWDVSSGYQVYMSNAAILTITGSEVDPSVYPIDLVEGWSLISYLGNVSQPVEKAMSSILDDIGLLKNALGDVFWPEMGVNEISSLVPGQGYKIHLLNNATLTYPMPTGTPVPPTNTPVPPTSTPVPPTSTPLPPGSGNQYFISPTGSDSRSGTAMSEAWATFDHAWTVMQAGDTLTLLDGVYYQSITPPSIGEPGNPIIIRAQNDGKAIIDGEFVRYPVDLYHFNQVEGIVGRNSVRHVFRIDDYNTLKRVSGYNSDVDENTAIISIVGDYNLVEDCVAAGTARKMVFAYGASFGAQHNTIRRCFVDWQRWDGRNHGSCWPWGEGLEWYGASYGIMENSIAYSRTARAGISIISQSMGQQAIGNQILGSMSVYAGMQEDGETPMWWGDTRPQPSDYDCVVPIYDWPGWMSGIVVANSGSTVTDTLLQDILSYGNARYGLTSLVTGNSPITENIRINRATVFHNGLNNQNERQNGGIGAGAKDSELANFSSITNSNIENIFNQGDRSFSSMSGEGARLTRRYVDGVLTNESLWPWPMEERIKDELGYSVTCIMGTIINDAYAAGQAAEGIDMTSRDPNWASDATNLVVQACNNQ